MKKISGTLLISAGIAISFMLLWSSESTAISTFNNGNLKGDYAFAASAWPDGGVAGRLTADGAGNITNGFLTLAGGGDVHHESLNCTYAVFPDGTGTMTCHTMKLDGPGMGDTASGTSDLVLVDGGKEFYGIDTNLGGEVEGLVSMAKRQ